MKHLQPSRSSLFLMELLIAILFFSLASAVCVQLFARSHQLSDDAAQLHMAVIQAQNVEEALFGCNGDLDAAADLFPECTRTREGLTIYYDEAWNMCTSQEYYYCLNLTLAGETLLEGNITITGVHTGEALYQLPVKLKIPTTFSLEG